MDLKTQIYRGLGQDAVVIEDFHNQLKREGHSVQEIVKTLLQLRRVAPHKINAKITTWAVGIKYKMM
jgi:predicted component of type VI protein secretion system